LFSQGVTYGVTAQTPCLYGQSASGYTVTRVTGIFLKNIFFIFLAIYIKKRNAKQRKSPVNRDPRHTRRDG
jgi:hypothetical protein